MWGVTVLPCPVGRYHGMITREQTGRLLDSKDGNYLVRSGLSHAGSYSLSFV